MNCTVLIHKTLLHKIFSIWSPRGSEVFVGLVDELFPTCTRDASKNSVNNELCGMLSKIMNKKPLDSKGNNPEIYLKDCKLNT